jgi:outer membrane protein OmpA-like peptidoglycan-associated protein
MTATTFDETLLDGAPRRTVEDAWRTLNTRYAIGTALLLAMLALLWAIGFGPGASRTATPEPGVATRAADVPAGAARATAGAAPASPAAATGDASSANRTGGASAGATGGTPGGGAAAATAAAASGGASTGASGASGASASGGEAAAGAGGPRANGGAAALPRPIPGAPVARLYFEPDQAWPSGEVGRRLAPVLARLKAEPDTRALVSGFHDRRGPVERNAALAQRRAQAVRRVLIREGIAADRIVLARPQQTQGSGNDREARRVEVTVAR